MPFYNPRFASAAEAPYDDDELVIGVEIDGEAKAYAIGPLNAREMVNDELAGIPILVTWCPIFHPLIGPGLIFILRVSFIGDTWTKIISLLNAR